VQRNGALDAEVVNDECRDRQNAALRQVADAVGHRQLPPIFDPASWVAAPLVRLALPFAPNVSSVTAPASALVEARVIVAFRRCGGEQRRSGHADRLGLRDGAAEPRSASDSVVAVTPLVRQTIRSRRPSIR